MEEIKKLTLAILYTEKAMECFHAIQLVERSTA